MTKPKRPKPSKPKPDVAKRILDRIRDKPLWIQENRINYALRAAFRDGIKCGHNTFSNCSKDHQQSVHLRAKYGVKP